MRIIILIHLVTPATDLSVVTYLKNIYISKISSYIYEIKNKQTKKILLAAYCWEKHMSLHTLRPIVKLAVTKAGGVGIQ